MCLQLGSLVDLKIRSLLYNELLRQGRRLLLVELEAQAHNESLGHDRVIETISRSAIAVSIFAVQSVTGSDRIQGQFDLYDPMFPAVSL